MANREVTLKVDGADITVSTDDANAAWVQKQVGVPSDNPVTQALTTVDGLLTTADTYLGIADTAAAAVQTLAPLYSNAINAITREAINTARNALYSLSLNGHVLFADAPYGITHGAPFKDTTAYKKYLELFAPPGMLDAVPLPQPKGGAPGLLDTVLASLGDEGDSSKPYLNPQTAVAGVTLVVGAKPGVDVQKVVEAIRKLVLLLQKILNTNHLHENGLLLDRNTAWAPRNVRIRNVVMEQGKVAPVLYWEHDPLSYPYGGITADGILYEVSQPPTELQLWSCSNPVKFNKVPPASSFYDDALPGNSTTTDPDWVLLDSLEVPLNSAKTNLSVVRSAAGKILAPSWNLNELVMGPLPLSDGAVRQCSIVLRYVFPPNALTYTVPGETAVTIDLQAGPSLPVMYTARATPDRPAAASVKPDWYAYGTRYVDDPASQGAVAARTLLDEAIGQLDQHVITPFEDSLKDSSDTIVASAKATRAYIKDVRDTVTEIRGIVSLLRNLSQLQVMAYGRAFQYALDPTGGADTAGRAALEKEYRTSLGQLPFQGNDDVVFGAFIVMTAPANAATQLTPLLNAIKALLGLNESAAAKFSNIWQDLTGEASPTAAPPLPGPTTSNIGSVTQPLIGADDQAGVDNNCPPPRDLSKLTFSDALVPAGI